MRKILYLSLIILLFGCNSRNKSLVFKVEKVKKELLIQSEQLSKFDSIEIQIRSHRNSKISNSTDRSTENPEGVLIAKESEVWYPIVDIMPENNGNGILSFNDTVSGHYSMNGMFFKSVNPIQKQISIEKERLLYWENSLTLEPKGALNEFYLDMRDNHDILIV